MTPEKVKAYKVQGIVRYLCELGWDYSEAYDLCEEYDLDLIRYRYNIPDCAINKYLYMAYR